MKPIAIKIPLNIYIFSWCLLGVLIFTYSFTNDIITQSNNQKFTVLIKSLAFYLALILYCVKYLKENFYLKAETLKPIILIIPVNIYLFTWSLFGFFVYSYSFSNAIINEDYNQTRLEFIPAVIFCLIYLLYCLNYVKEKYRVSY